MNNQEYKVIHKSEKEVHDFFNKINLENGSNYKIKVIEEFKNSKLLKLIFLMAYDRVNYLYGMSLNSLQPEELDGTDGFNLSLEDSLNYINTVIVTRELTGNAAIESVNNLLKGSSKENARIIRNIIDRNLKINTGTTSINKVHKGLIKKPVYMRCGVYNEKTKKRISFPAYLQLKADGTYREARVDSGLVQFQSRSGESYFYPKLANSLSTFKDGVIFGELLVLASEEVLKAVQKHNKNNDEKTERIVGAIKQSLSNGTEYILPRELGNGLINSDNIPNDSLLFVVWDFVTPGEYSNAAEKKKNKTPYKERLEFLSSQVNGKNNIRIIPTNVVNNLSEALKLTSEYMAEGLEGSIIKNTDGIFKDGTSNDQLKLKLAISAEVRITGFTEGTGKNKDYFGAITFENDERTVKGQVGVSSMTESLRNEISANREYYMGKIMEVEFNDITQARGSSTWAFSHPRFIELRADKDETNTLQEIRDMKLMAITDMSS